MGREDQDSKYLPGQILVGFVTNEIVSQSFSSEHSLLAPDCGLVMRAHTVIAKVI